MEPMARTFSTPTEHYFLRRGRNKEVVDEVLYESFSLCRRIERYVTELFVFVAVPGVPSENNAVERSLRHVVTTRKISGGTRSKQGTNSNMALASVFGTCRTRELNPLVQCSQLLVSPQD